MPVNFYNHLYYRFLLAMKSLTGDLVLRRNNKFAIMVLKYNLLDEYSGVIYTANPDVETDDSGKSETDIPA